MKDSHLKLVPNTGKDIDKQNECDCFMCSLMRSFNIDMSDFDTIVIEIPLIGISRIIDSTIEIKFEADFEVGDSNEED